MYARRIMPVITGATSLLEPAWDFAGRLWAVDRRADGAVVSYLAGDDVATVEVPGISGADVKEFLVSRDGSRLVAVIRQRVSDVVVVSRLLQNSSGQVVRATRAQQVDELLLVLEVVGDVGDDPLALDRALEVPEHLSAPMHPPRVDADVQGAQPQQHTDQDQELGANGAGGEPAEERPPGSGGRRSGHRRG